MNNIVTGSTVDPSTSPRFQRSAIQTRQLARDTVRAGLAAGFFLIGGWVASSFSPASIWPTIFGCNAAALMLFATGLWSASQVTDWRRKEVGLPGLPPSPLSRRLRDLLMRPWSASAAGESPQQDLIERWVGRTSSLVATGVNRLGTRAVSLAALAIFALLVAFSDLTWDADPSSSGRLGYSIGGICLALAFGLLVMERSFAAADDAEWPEAEKLMVLARLPIVTLTGTAFSLLLATQWAAKLPAILACLSTLVALEFLIRAIIAMFSPQRDGVQPEMLAQSLVADGLRWPPRPLTALQTELRNRSGIDLRQIWALTFIRRAFPALAAGMVLVGWLITGVSEVPMAGRGIYERFGKPIAVVHPGLHTGLPWPFGRVVPVENGIVHELATSIASATAAGDAEGPAPEGANRLWDGTHVSEKSQIIASQSDGKQSFQIVNMDVRFVYRIGLSDQAALDAAYRTVDVPALLEDISGRVLVRDLAVRTLDDVLGEGRVDMADEIAVAIRADLDRLHSGVEVLAVVIEAIHPPAGAANAYHAVQAAEITAQALVSRERGRAAQSANEAQLAASVEQDKATADARESIAASDVARLRFAAEDAAYREVGAVFLTEAYFTQLTAGLGHAKALILDHRIGGQTATTFDLRSVLTPIDPDPSGKPGIPLTGKEVKP